jgi:hypothetical protein
MRPRRLGLTRALAVLLAFVAIWALFMGIIWVALGGWR